jgi:hypothetical protein
MRPSLMRVIQLVSCLVMGFAGVLAFAPAASAKAPCPNIICTLDFPDLTLSCTYNAGSKCSMPTSTSCQPGSC